jgi:hypothetical protein
MDARLGLVIEWPIQAACIKVEAHEINGREEFPLSQSKPSKISTSPQNRQEEGKRLANGVLGGSVGPLPFFYPLS